MSTGLRVLGTTQRFFTSDSRLVSRTPLGLSLLGTQSRTGYNGENTYGVVMGSCPRFVKANGARAMRSKRSRDTAYEYIRVSGGAS